MTLQSMAGAGIIGRALLARLVVCGGDCATYKGCCGKCPRHDPAVATLKEVDKLLGGKLPRGHDWGRRLRERDVLGVGRGWPLA